jgi:hypothetical protein
MLLSAGLGIGEMVFQKLNGFQEAAGGDRHDQINGVEVTPAIKTSGQVSLGICRRMKPTAKRAAESENFLAVSCLKSQPLDNQINIDFIAQPSEKTICV